MPQPRGLGGVMGDVQDGAARQHLGGEILHPRPRSCIERREGFVQQHHRPILHHRPGKRHPLPLTAR